MKSVITEILRRAKEERKKPLQVSVLGQTGVGKSSLINAMFGTNFKVGDVEPCTKELQSHSAKLIGGGEIVFNDLPGVGEASEADSRYLESYLEVLNSANVVLWTVHADSRSTTFDSSCLQYLVQKMPTDQRRICLNKIVLVLTKCDLIVAKPWIAAHSTTEIQMIPSVKSKELLAQKAVFAFDRILGPYHTELISETYNESGFNPIDERFSIVGENVNFSGVLSSEECASLLIKYPQYRGILERLRDHHSPVVCSARYRFNLVPLMQKIIGKMDFSALQRCRDFIKNFNPIALKISDGCLLDQVSIYDIVAERTMLSFTDYFHRLEQAYDRTNP